MPRYTFLPMASHYSTDLQVAVTRQDMLQCGKKGRGEEDCKLVNMDVNNAGFKTTLKIGFANVSCEGSTGLSDLNYTHNAFW